MKNDEFVDKLCERIFWLSNENEALKRELETLKKEKENEQRQPGLPFGGELESRDCI